MTKKVFEAVPKTAIPEAQNMIRRMRNDGEKTAVYC